MTQPSIRRNALACALALALTAPLALAQSAATTDPAKVDSTKKADGKNAEELEKVVVTGTHIKRAEIEGPAPVTVITAEDIKKQGFATVYDVLQTITEAIGNVQNDYDWGQSSVNAYPLNLRNLGPGRSLLLINGHRVADYPMPYQGKSNFANYNNIPTGIVERIEVLSGSASAIYGSDAMAGVVNVILKEHAEDQTLRVRWGEATRGGRRNMDFVFSGGTTGDNWNLTYNLQHFDRGVLLAGDRPFMDAEDDKDFVRWGPAERHYGVGALLPSPGLYLRERGNVVAVGGVGNVTYRIAPPAGACDQYGDLYYLQEIRGYDRNTGAESNAGSYCAQRVFKNWALRTGSEDNSGYLHGTYDFGDGLQAWSNLGVWKSTGDFNTFLDGFYSGIYWDPRANHGAGGRRDMLKYQSPEELGGEDAVLTKSRELAVDFSAGLRGRLFNDRFDWEAMLGRAEYEVKESFPTLNQGDMFDFYMGPQLGTAANGDPIYAPDYDKLWNPVSPGDTAAFSRRGEKKARSWLTQGQFTLSGDLFEGWAGPVGFAGVLEFGKQGYKLTPDPKTLDQDEDGWYTPFGNIEQGGGTRDHYAAGVEFRVPLHETLTANVAGRYDRYDATADDAAFTYQLGLEWRPVSDLLIRGTYGTSFRAPDMHYVYALPSSGVSDFTDYVACYEGGWPAQQCPRDEFKIENATVRRGGTPDLRYEDGKSWTVGFVWDAFEGFSFGTDYWYVKINNLIDDISAEQLLLDEAYCKYKFTPDGSVRSVEPTDAYCADVISRIKRDPSLPVSSPDDVSEILVNPINRAETQVAGVDLKASYSLPQTTFGNWNFNLGYTNMLSYKSRGFPSDPLRNTRKNENPRTRITASMNWSLDQWNATLMMYQKSGGRDNLWGGCEPLADGYGIDQLTRIDDHTCKDLDPDSPTFGQTSARHYERRAPRRYFNGSVGYQINEAFKVNLYVSNLFDKIYGDKWCGDFAYCVDDPVGREVSAELVYKF